MFADIATDQKLPAFLRMHEAAFEYLGGVTQEILYDNTKTVVLKTLTQGVDSRGEVKLNPEFADFARYWGFTPRLCRPYRPQTKGKVESGVGYLRKNFLCGRDATDLDDLRQQMRVWSAEVANVRLHGTTHRLVGEAWQEEKPSLQSAVGRRAYPLVVQALRRATPSSAGVAIATPSPGKTPARKWWWRKSERRSPFCVTSRPLPFTCALGETTRR
jgi:hypothetical protein